MVVVAVREGAKALAAVSQSLEGAGVVVEGQRQCTRVLSSAQWQSAQAQAPPPQETPQLCPSAF